MVVAQTFNTSTWEAGLHGEPPPPPPCKSWLAWNSPDWASNSDLCFPSTGIKGVPAPPGIFLFCFFVCFKENWLKWTWDRPDFSHSFGRPSCTTWGGGDHFPLSELSFEPSFK